MGGTVPRRTRDWRPFVTLDSDPLSSLSRASRDRVRENDEGQDFYPTGDCFWLTPSQWQFLAPYVADLAIKTVVAFENRSQQSEIP
ncbi:MAG: hypothetical protein ACLP5H_11755 [Desulfomonilaceae bacterium]